MNGALLLAGPGVPDTEALRHNALVASWQRDRLVAARRVRQRWMVWTLLRVVLPLLLLGSLAIGLELHRPGFWQVLVLRGEWPVATPATLSAATPPPAPSLQTAAAAALVPAEALPAQPAAAIPSPTPTSEPASLAGSAATAETVAAGPGPAVAPSSIPPLTAGDAPPAIPEPAAGAAIRPALRFDLTPASMTSPSLPTTPPPGVTRP